MDLIASLKQFNRKERFILLCQTLGFEDQSFRLSDSFRCRLGDRLNTEVPKDAFAAMDYHLDWLQMAMYLAENARPDYPIPNDGLVAGNQQDVDLLVCFPSGSRTHLVLIEAKADSAWSNKQLCRKAKRLGKIFGEGQPDTQSVIPSFVLMSPTKPDLERLKTCSWPDWMKPSKKPIWLRLPLSPGLKKPTRCNEAGKSDAGGNRITLNDVRHSDPNTG